MHTVEEAYWFHSRLSWTETASFLRDLTLHHPRLDPETGVLGPQSPKLTGHPALFATVAGVAFASHRPASLDQAVRIGRALNIVADASTVLVLPVLVAGLGASPAAGVVAAFLYAVFPPAVVYGSIANFDPFLAPLATLAIALALRPGSRARVAGSAIATGLAIAAKQTALALLAVVPVLVAVARGGGWRTAALDRARDVLLWAALAGLTVAAFASPPAYLDSLIAPRNVYAQPSGTPWTSLRTNLGLVARPRAYYRLSFSRHGEPLSPLLARVHPLVTPAFLVAYAGAGLAFALRGRWRRLVALYLPAVVVLALVRPSDGMWRFQLLFPLVCAGGAIGLAEARPRLRLVFATASVALAISVVAPARLDPRGAVDLADLLFMNPQARQRHDYFDPWRGSPLVVRLAPGVALQRRFFAAPGSAAVAVTADGPVDLRLDGAPIALDELGQATVALAGRLHRLELTMPGGGEVRGIRIAPDPRAD
jgi:hypothetical protein